MEQEHDVSKRPSSMLEYVRLLAKTSHTVRWVFGLMDTSKSRAMLICIVLCSTVGMACFSYGSYTISDFFTAAENRNYAAVVSNLAWFSLMLCLAQFSWLMGSFAWETFFSIGMPLLNARILAMLYEKPLGQLVEESSRLNPATLERGRNRAGTIVDLVIHQAIPYLIRIGFGIIGLSFISPITSISIIIVAVLFVVVSMVMNRWLLGALEHIDAEHQRFNRRWVERAENVPCFVTAGAADAEQSRLLSWQKETMHADWRVWNYFHLARTIRDSVLLRGAHVLVVGLSGYAVFNQTLTVPECLPILLWWSMIADGISSWSNLEREFFDVAVKVESMREALVVPPVFSVTDGSPIEKNGPVRVTFDGIGLNYREGEHRTPALRGITFEMMPGERIALIGESGSGKTSIANLLLRAYDPDSGSICINGVDLRKLSLGSYMRNLVGYAPQQSQIIDGTLADNLLLGVSNDDRVLWSRERLEEVMRTFQLDFGEGRLIDGIYTKVGPHGIKLSGGQAQRLALARAVIKRPRLLIIDEGTSSLDAQTEQLVVESIRRASEKVTTIVIAHRLATVRDCDRIIYLRPVSKTNPDESQIVAIATSFEDLAAQVPEFRHHAKLQGIEL